MKKFLLLLSAAVMAISASAQFDASKTAKGLLTKSADAMPTLAKRGMKKAPSKIALENNQRVLGWYTTDEIDTYGLGLGMDATLKLGVYIPSTMLTKFEGGKVVKIRFGLAEAATVNNVFLIPVTDNGIGAPVILQDLPLKAKKGWNEVTIDTPAELVTDGSTDYLLGYEYVQKSGSYPLGSHPTLGGMSFIYGDLGSGEGWYNMGTDYAFSVQAIVELDNLPTYSVLLNGFYTEGMYAKAGAEMPYGLELENFGAEIPADYTVDIALDGQVISTVSSPIALANAPQEYSGTLTLPEGIETGEHTLTAIVSTVAGEQVTGSEEKAAPVFIYQDGVERQKYLVEQATSHSCTYCPLGEAVLNAVAANVDVAWAAIHGNMSATDPYYFADNNKWFSMMGLTGFPSGAFNRLNFDEDGLMAGLGYNASYAAAAGEYFAEVMKVLSAPAFATVNIETAYDEATKNLSIKVSGEAVEDFKKIYGEDASVTVYLTENGLVNRQLNQGTWVAKYNHEHVLRQYVTPYFGEQMKWNGNEYENTYNVTLNSAWKPENMNVIAFLTRKIDINNIDINKMDVNNAEIVKVGESISTGIDAVIENSPMSNNVYNLSGQKVGEDYKGVVIRNGKKYVR